MSASTTLTTAGVALAAGLLVWAGAAKVAVPDGAMATLHRLRLPSGRIAARLLGLGEVLLGVLVLAVGGVPAAAVILLVYATFSLVAAWQRRAQVACGCFGTTRTAVTRLHITTNVLFAAAGAAGLLSPPDAISDLSSREGALVGGTAVLLVATGVALLQALLLRAAAEEVLAA